MLSHRNACRILCCKQACASQNLSLSDGGYHRAEGLPAHLPSTHAQQEAVARTVAAWAAGLSARACQSGIKPNGLRPWEAHAAAVLVLQQLMYSCSVRRRSLRVQPPAFNKLQR